MLVVVEQIEHVEDGVQLLDAVHVEVAPVKALDVSGRIAGYLVGDRDRIAGLARFRVDHGHLVAVNGRPVLVHALVNAAAFTVAWVAA